MKPRWLEWAQELQAIAQAGLEYSKDRFDLARFQRVRELAVEIMHTHTDVKMEKLVDLFANESGYQTPKVDVRAIVTQEGKLLLVQEMDDRRWALPGGWAEIGLSLAENVEKEVTEESGLTVRAERVIAVLDRNRHVNDNYPYSVYRMFVLCRMDGEDCGEFQKNLETMNAAFFAENELPELSCLRNTPEQVAMCFSYVRGERSEVYFD